MASKGPSSLRDQGSPPEPISQATGSGPLPRRGSGAVDASTSARRSPSGDEGTSPNVQAPTRNDDLPMRVKDAIFLHQIQQPRPLSITPSTIIEAGIDTGEKDTANVHHALVKAGVLVNSNKAPRTHHLYFPHLNGDKPTGNEEFVPDTSKISSSLPNKLKILTVPGVKFLVKVLFFWEEEVARWRAKEQDLDELVKAWGKYTDERKALEVSPGNLGEEELKEEKDRLEKMSKEVEFHIQAVRMRQKVRPSKREVDDQLPKYQ